MNKNNNTFQFKFLEDKPAQTDEELEELGFGHKEIGGTLINIVEKCPTPFTIGLFGKWGSGKSSIAYFLKKYLPKKGIPVVIFDVWKHQKDALRRTFLKEVVNQLSSKKYFIKEDFKIDDRLESSVSKTQEGKFKINWEKLKQVKKWGVIALFFLGFIGYLAYKFGYFRQFSYGITILISTIFGGSFVTWLLKTATQFLTTETTTFSINKFRDPYEFEKEFIRVIKNLKSKRILIVFDNLDRVTHDRAMEVLTTVKTFLEPKDVEIQEKEVVFLIPCDVEAIKTHIRSVYKIEEQKGPFDPDEFIKKFFNAILRIPDFIPSELESYTAEKLKETGITELDNPTVAWIITKAFRENPRQIKQFINVLLANYLLIKTRSGEGKDFPIDFLQNNTPQLAKYLILDQLFSEEIQKLRDERIWSLEEVTANILNTKNAEVFIKFIIETKPIIPITNLRIFFTLRRSEQEKEFPGIEEFFGFLKDKRIDDAKKFLVGIKDFENRKGDFSKIIRDELMGEPKQIFAVSMIDTLLNSLDSTGLSLTQTIYGEIYNRLTTDLKEYLYIISPEILSRQLLTPYEGYRDLIIKQWIVILEDQKNSPPKYKVDNESLQQLFKTIVENTDWFINYQERIKKVLAERFIQEIYIAELFGKKKEAQKAFISPDYINSFIGSISPQDIESRNLSKKVEILSQFEAELFTVTTGQNILNKLIELQNYEKNKPFDEARQKFKEELNLNTRNILKRFNVFLKGVSNQNIWTQIIDATTQGMNIIGDWDNRRIFILLLLELEQFIQEPKLSEIRSNVVNFFNVASQPSIDYVISKIDKPIEFLEKSYYTGTIENRALGDQGIFDYFYSKINEEFKSNWLVKLFDRDYSRALNKIEQENYKGMDQIKITQKILEVVERISAEEKLKFYSACNKMKCGNDSNTRDLYISKLKVHLTSTDQVLQKVGSQAFSDAKFLGKMRRRQIIKDVFDWLRSPTLQDKYQPFSIQVVATEIELFSESYRVEEKNDFLQFIFDEIRRTTRLESINLGFEILCYKSIRPKYEDRKENFNDLKVRFETETNTDIKNALLTGLKKLRPSKLNANNRVFWEWVDGQKL